MTMIEYVPFSLNPLLESWGTGLPKGITDLSRTPGHDRVRVALRNIGEALAALGDRTGEREDAARAWLTPHHDKLTAALETYEGVGLDVDGPLALALSDQFAAAQAEVMQAQDNKRSAEPADVLAARDALDLAEAQVSKVHRHAAELREALTFPALPRAEIFAAAREQTRALNQAPKSARTLQRALEQGATAKPDEARLWICWESPASQAREVLSWRWQRYLEEHGA